MGTRGEPTTASGLHKNEKLERLKSLACLSAGRTELQAPLISYPNTKPDAGRDAGADPFIEGLCTRGRGTYPRHRRGLIEGGRLTPNPKVEMRPTLSSG